MISASTLVTAPSALTSPSPESKCSVSTTSGAVLMVSSSVSTGSATTLDRASSASRLLEAPSRSMSPHQPRDGQNVALETVSVGNRLANDPAADISLNASVSGDGIVSGTVYCSCASVTRAPVPVGATDVNFSTPDVSLAVLTWGGGQFPARAPLKVRAPGFHLR